MKFRRMISVLTAMVISTAALGSMTASSNSSDRNRLYKVFDYETGTVVDSYILDHESATSAASTYAVIGGDDRVEYANSGIVWLSSIYNNEEESSGSTGFIVGDHVIATAAHCVYGITADSYNTTYEITLYDDEGNQVDKIDPVTVHVPYLFTIANPGDEREWKYDYALITVAEDLSDYEHFNLGVAVGSPIGTPVTVSGFPEQIGSNDLSGQLYTGTGSVVAFNNPDDVVIEHCIRYNADTSGGQSGAPVYITTSYQIDDDTPVFSRTAIAIHTRPVDNSNNGVRFTSELINFYRNNPNLNLTE